VTRSRALEAVAEVERRLRAQARAAAALASDVAVMRRRNGIARRRDLEQFNLLMTRSAFACAASAARRTLLFVVDAALGHQQSAADESARLAQAAIVPWAQMRRGLERRAARRVTKQLA
jgi:hypothetical protein